MLELVFVEGVSGVGKSTMVHMLSDELKAQGYTVKEYVEFDYTMAHCSTIRLTI